MRVLAPGVYDGLRTDEHFTVDIQSVGGAYIVLGTVNNFDLVFSNTVTQVDITPAILAGPHTVNRVHLHLIYSKDAPPSSYTIEVADENGQVVDTIQSTLNPNRQLPYNVDVDLVARVL
jgi:hypothetical protein